jgi:hypothetical protein
VLPANDASDARGVAGQGDQARRCDRAAIVRRGAVGQAEEVYPVLGRQPAGDALLPEAADAKSKIQSAISRDSWLDTSYVCRLINGTRSHPSRDALILLGVWGMELDVHEMDELLIAAEYKPLVLPTALR